MKRKTSFVEGAAVVEGRFWSNTFIEKKGTVQNPLVMNGSSLFGLTRWSSQIQIISFSIAKNHEADQIPKSLLLLHTVFVGFDHFLEHEYHTTFEFFP